MFIFIRIASIEKIFDLHTLNVRSFMIRKLLTAISILLLFSFSGITVADTDLFFGDSLMYGFGTVDHFHTWPNLYCASKGTIIDNRAMGGYAMTPGVSSFGAFDINNVPNYDPKYHYIFIGYGINDYYFGSNPALYASYTSSAVDGIIAKGYDPSQIVLVWTWFYGGSEAVHITWRSALYNVAVIKHTKYVDFSAPLIADPNRINYVENDAHVNVQGHQVFAGIAETSIIAPQTLLLPVQLISFSGHRENENSTLQWIAGDEEKGDKFDVERSNDGQHFNSIGIVAGKEGNNNQYQLTDNSTGPVFYYRIKVTNIAGNSFYSRIIILRSNNAPGNSIRLLSNPVTQNIPLQVSVEKNEKLQLSLIDLSGKQLLNQTMAVYAGINQLNMYLPANYSRGVYLLQVKSAQVNSTLRVMVTNK
jgi:GDSL-like Lipase/Acylhydrolase family